MPNGGVSNYKTLRDFFGPRWGRCGVLLHRELIIVKGQIDASVSTPNLTEQFIPVVVAARRVTRFANEALDLFGVQPKRCSGAAYHIFFHHHAPEIVGPKFQCHLPNPRPLRHPGALDILDVVQKNPGQRLRPQIFRHARLMFHFQNRVLRLEGPANESGKAATAVLLLANSLQMFHPLGDGFDVTEHHRRARFQSQFVRDLPYLQPFVTLDFEWRNSLAHPVNQNFATTTGDGAEAGFLEFREHFPQWHSKNFREVLELRRTEPMNIDLRIFLSDVVQQIDIPFEAQLRVMSALHQDLNPADSAKFIQLLIELLERDDMMVVVLFGAIKRAELAVNVADVRVIDVAIDDVGNDFVARAVVG